jgi:hypothetical protein
MDKKTTIVITPRDRYSELAGCIKDIYAYTDEASFELIILDLGYPAEDLAAAKQELAGRNNYRILDFGRIIPMAAMSKVRDHINTPFAAFMDNDSRALPGWLPPLVATAEQTQAAIVFPITLERAGVDEGADIRNHLFTTRIHVIDVEKTPYLVEYKTHRRTLPEQLPQEVTESESFELHCVMFNTAILKTLELPHMTIREHLDIGMQCKARNLKIYVVPQSRIVFDNLATPGKLADLKYFNLRWSSQITWQSSRLFEKRWGYKFYSEYSIYNWAIRRRLFLLMRWLCIPIGLANKIDRLFMAVRRRVAPIWDPIKDAEAKSTSLYDRLPNRTPQQLDHSVI